MRLKGKTALITGGARGIGKEIALLFAQEGADLAICDLEEQTLENTKKELEAFGRRVLCFKTDVRNYSQVDEMVNNILDKFSHIDILVNNAGITRDSLFIKMDEKMWDMVLEVNLKGAFNCIKAVSRSMLRKRSGKIINISSIIGLIGNIGQANYAASKAAIIGLTKSLAKEFASRNICVNAIAPGFISTEMTKNLPQEIKEKMLKNIPLGRFGEPQDVARLCLFLASEESNYITGEVIVIDGGMSMH